MVMNREPQHKYMVNDQDNTQMNGGDVTHAIDDGKGMEAHKLKVNDQDNTQVDGGDGDDERKTKAQKYMVNDQDNTKTNGGDVTHAIDQYRIINISHAK